MAVVNRDSPFGSSINGIADKCELISIRRRILWTEVVMKMDGIASNLIRSELHQPAGTVEFRIIEYAHPGPAHFTHLDITEVDIGARHENHVPTRALRIFGANDNVTTDVARMRQELELAIRIARATMIVLKRCRYSDLIP